jgi:hypothetical protein
MKHGTTLAISAALVVAFLLGVILAKKAIQFRTQRQKRVAPVRVQPSKRDVPRYTGPVKQDGSIFVSIASYRDKDCMHTIRDAVAHASDPSRIAFGVVEQILDPSEACVPPELASHVRVMTLSHAEARGPCYARYLCSTLYQGETWFFQIDSHTRFAQGWDDALRAMAEASESATDRTVISHYPPPFSPDAPVQPQAASVPRMHRPTWGDRGILQMAALQQAPTDRPARSPYVGGNMLFMPGRAVRDVPFDDSLDHLFHMEELCMSVRLFTSGYDVYAPTQNVVYHFYKRGGHPKFWEDMTSLLTAHESRVASENTARSITGIAMEDGSTPPPYTGAFGPGSARTVRDFWTLANQLGVAPP